MKKLLLFFAILAAAISASAENYILYTSSDGKIVNPLVPEAFGATIVSNTYENGHGKLLFDGEVTTIGKNAFIECKSLTSVEIPNSVSTIGESAFYGCTGLMQVVIPNSVTMIENYAFTGCKSLSKLVIEDGNKSLSLGYNKYNAGIVPSSGEGLFYDCPLTSLYLGRNLSYNGDLRYGRSPFSYNKLTELTIGLNVTEIGSFAFSNCTSLTSVEIPNSVISIRNYAFSGCTSLASVEIPSSVTSIGTGAFYCCSSLPVIDGIRYAGTYLVEAADKTLRNFTIMDGTRWIGKEAFCGCSSLTSFVIPNSVKSIEERAFSGCSGLTGVYINDLESWCNIYFYSYDSNPLYYAHNLYLDNELVTDLAIPNSVTSIGQYTFKGCSCLTSIEIPNSVTSIREGVFSGCSSLTSFEIPNSVTTIGKNAFEGCTSLSDLVISDGESTLELDYNHYPSSSTGIGLFYDCPLTSLYVGRNLSYKSSYIENKPFYNKKKLKELTIGQYVTSIEESAFQDCSNLTSVKIGNSVKEIGKNAFYGTKLERVDITDLSAWCKIAFRGNNYANPIFVAGNLYINNELASDITIPSDINELKFAAFYGCTCLKSVTIPESVIVIQKSAFCGCSKLLKVNIGKNVEKVVDYAFYECSAIKDIYSLASLPPTCGEYVFYGINDSRCTIHVPEKSVGRYEKATGWKDFYIEGMTDDEIEALGIEDVYLDINLENNDQTFNLSGKQVSTDYRGIVIQNGKKLLKR